MAQQLDQSKDRKKGDNFFKTESETKWVLKNLIRLGPLTRKDPQLKCRESKGNC